MSHDGAAAEKAAEARQDKRSRQPSLVRRVIPIPGTMGRGRTTVRHFSGLLLGGYIARVESLRRQGRRGPLFAFERLGGAICAIFVNPEIAAEPFPVQLRRRLEG